MGRLNNEEKPEGEKTNHLFRHFSHEHPLELSCNAAETGQVIPCVGCGIHVLAGKTYYTCKPCRFSLHSACYNMPRKVRHPADPHDLILLLMPSFACKACGKPGSGLAFNCGICHQSYHSLCSVLPLSTSHHAHPHVLNLEFFPPYDSVKAFRCDICRGLGYDHWLYRCGPCGFDVHLDCALSNHPPQPYVMSTDNCSNQRNTPPNQNTFVPTTAQPGNQVLYYVQTNAPQQVNPGGYQYGNNQNQGGMSGMKYMIAGSVASGMGQAVAQEMLHSIVTSGLGGGSASSGNGDSDIASSWVGDGANYL